MTNNAVISTKGKNLFRQELPGRPELLRRYHSITIFQEIITNWPSFHEGNEEAKQKNLPKRTGPPEGKERTEHAQNTQRKPENGKWKREKEGPIKFNALLNAFPLQGCTVTEVPIGTFQKISTMFEFAMAMVPSVQSKSDP